MRLTERGACFAFHLFDQASYVVRSQRTDRTITDRRFEMHPQDTLVARPGARSFVRVVR
jgi:hypothetical protein